MPGNEDVEVRESGIPGAGRGLFALRDFQPGDAVLSVDRPLVAELDIERLIDSCAWCFQRGATDPQERAHAASMGLPAGFIEVKSCTGCRRVSYCSRKCQSRAWKTEHKYECKVIAPDDRPNLPEAVRAVIKLLGRLKAEGNKDDRLQEILNFRPFSAGRGLEDFARRDKQLFDSFNMLGFAAWKYTGEPKLEGVDSQVIAKALLLNVVCNKFNLASPLEDTHLGVGFDPLICSANHSCEPNVNLVFNQPATILRALVPIRKGGEIFTKYVDVTNPFSVRQREIEGSYYFSCQCSKCLRGPVGKEDVFSKPVAELSAQYCKLADSLIQRHEKQLSNFRIPNGVETEQRRLAALEAEAFSVAGTGMDTKNPSIVEVKEALKSCVESGLWSWTRQPVPQLCHQLYGLYIAGGDHYRAFRLGLKLHFEITPGLYPQAFAQDKLINTWAMSTLTNVLCGPANKGIYEELMKNGVDLRIAYFGFLFDVHDNIPKMYGKDSPFGRVVESTYEQIMAGVTIQESEIRDRIKEMWPSLETIGRSVYVNSL